MPPWLPSAPTGTRASRTTTPPQSGVASPASQLSSVLESGPLIKELLNGQEMLRMRDTSGFLQELLCQSVGHVSQQLQKPEFKQIESITQLSRIF
ncbi:hypothetical protein PAMP_015567 [Pampus punctatissimus]